MAEDFYEAMEHVDEAIRRAQTGSADNAIGHVLVALSMLRQYVTQQHEQIVHVNSKVEYGYTDKEVAR